MDQPSDVRDLGHDLEINAATYEWTGRLFRLLEKILRVNIKLHHSHGQIAEGDIFLFNHFARFETFIPQYLIYRETGAYCRSVGAGEFFVKGDAFSNYLMSVGGVPNDLPDLFAFLAAEILRGRKVVVFPEGGMVKDRRVLDSRGGYSIYSRRAKERRKHHTGAAVLGLGVDMFKSAVLELHKAGRARRLQAVCDSLRIDGVDALLAAARRPTSIIPANITFYPIRIGDNLLRQGAELLNRGISRRMSEELMIEGNILLKHTDMDIRLGDGVFPGRFWRWQDRLLIRRLSRNVENIGEVFALKQESGPWERRLLAGGLRRNALGIRDTYMHRMYSQVSINLSHLASQTILHLMDAGSTDIDQATFHRALYLAVRYIRSAGGVHLHRSLLNPEWYGGLLDGDCPGLSQFLKTTAGAGLVKSDDGRYRFLPKLSEEHGFDEIRLENLVMVYANEVEPISAAAESVRRAVNDARHVSGRELARLRFEDEMVALEWDRNIFSKPLHQEINEQETATGSADPFLLIPDQAADLGIVLVHGFLSRPAELRDFGDGLAAEGYPVFGVRLKGHGTSPWDLRERTWEEWLASVRRGVAAMSEIVPQVCLVGFSTGGALCLLLAALQQEGVRGVAAVSPPFRFRNKNMIFVPILHRANRLVRWVSSYEGIMPFRGVDSEHPKLNYANMPIRGLYELGRMVEELDERLPQITCPVLLVQGTDDPVVDPESAEIILQKLQTGSRKLVMIPSGRHGILNEDVGDTRSSILHFVEELQGEQTRTAQANPP